MTNEEKSQEICEKNKRFKVECSSLECYLSAMDMAKWKDQQLKEQRRIIRKHWEGWADEQKQQLIEKACKWLEENIYHRVYECGDKLGFPTADFIEAFKKAMEE